MPMPEQVRKQSAAVQELYKQFEETSETQETQADETVDVTEPAVVKEQTIAADREYEQKYKTLQGMYNSEVVTVKRENAALKERLTQLENLLTTPQQVQSIGAVEKYITAKDEEDYGDTIDVIRRAAREEDQMLKSEVEFLKAELRKMASTVIPTIEQVTKTQSQNQEQLFWDRLTQAVPDWQTINNDAAFHEWLLEVDPISGFSKQVFLEDAQKRFDVGRIATLFNTWKRQINAPQAQQTSDARKSELEKQIAPAKAKSSNRQPQKDRVYSHKDIADFYADVRRGVYRGRDDERARIEADIFTAQVEGRIVAT